MTTPYSPSARTDPFSPGLQKVAAAFGIAFAVLLVVTILLGGADTPDFDAPLTEWSEYADDNADTLRYGALVFSLAVYCFLWFIGYLRGELGRAEMEARGFTRVSHVVYAAGIAGITSLALGVFLNAASTAHTDTNPDTIRALQQIAGAPFGLAMMAFATMLIAVGLFQTRVPLLPRWIGILGFVGGTFFLLTLGILLSDEYENGFGIFFPLAFLSLVIFTIGCSVTWLRRLGGPRTTATATADAAPPPPSAPVT